MIREQGASVKRHPRFGMIHPPRTRLEKLKHLQVLDTIPLEMVPAMEERSSFREEITSKHLDPISCIVMRNQFSPVDELVDAACKAVAGKEYDRSVWSMLSDRIIELLPEMDTADCGVVLKCVLLCPSGTIADAHQIGPALLARICEGASKAHKPGQYTSLYALQGIVRFNSHLDSKTRTKYFHFLIKSLRLSSTKFPVLISTVQSISKIIPVVSEVIVGPIFDELVSRTRNASSIDIASWVGLLSALARLPKTKESGLVFDSFSKELSDESFLVGFKIEQLSAVVHAYSRLGGPAVLTGSTQVFTILGNELIRCPDNEWTPRIFSVTLSAFGKAAVCHTDLLEFLFPSIARRVVPEMDEMQVSMTKTGLCRLGQANLLENLLNQ